MSVRRFTFVAELTTVRGIAAALAVLFFSNRFAAASQDIPKSVQLLIQAVDDYLKAGDRQEGIAGDANVDRILPLMKDISEAGKHVDKAELNALFPGLGDHLVDDLAAHADFLLKYIKTRDEDTFTRANAAIIRWLKWWKENKRNVNAAISNKYG